MKARFAILMLCLVASVGFGIFMHNPERQHKMFENFDYMLMRAQVKQDATEPGKITYEYQPHDAKSKFNKWRKPQY